VALGQQARVHVDAYSELLIFYPMWLLSGAFTPPESMGAVMRYARRFSRLVR
jgi:hypothetical protein